MKQWHLSSENCTAVSIVLQTSLLWLFPKFKEKKFWLWSLKQTIIFKSMAQWSHFLMLQYFLLHLRTLSINILNLRSWPGNHLALEVRFLWHNSIASNGIYQNYKLHSTLTSSMRTQLFVSKYFSYETNQM